MSEDKIQLGISSCLLGAKVRYDGEHQRDPFLVDQLGPFVQWRSICPELEVGMGVPRETVRLERRPTGLRMVGNQSGADWTARMQALAARRVKELDDLHGYVLKSKSPSCGMERVKVYQAGAPKGTGAPIKDGVGLFAAALLARYPNLPVEEEGRLQDAGLRDNFIERLFAYHRVRALWASRWTLGALVAFHTAHKMTLLAHGEPGYRELGRLIARGKSLPRAELRAQYEARFMATMKLVATRSRHTNVLMHMLGHLRAGVSEEDRAELRGLVEDYRRGLLPLIVPITLLRHHVERAGVAYLRGQTYLAPHPKELMLRNHV